MNKLEERKRLLLAEAAAHRALFLIEKETIRAKLDQSREKLRSHQGWLIAGALAGAWLLRGRMRGVASWLPALLGVARVATNLLPLTKR